MYLTHIELANLSVSPANMRAKHKDRDIAALIPSVKARGVLVPLLVRPNGAPDCYEIVAGRRRYFAAKAVTESGGGISALPCAVFEAGDDVAAIEASLIENTARLDADEVTQWETFARLIKEGRHFEDIAATFGLAEPVVRRVLALGNLLPRIRTLYRSEQIDAATIRHLTLATRQQQRDWLTLFYDPEGSAPTGRALKEWLFGGEAIPTSSALFDLADYTAPIMADLFDEHSYFTDSTLFWTLQDAALQAKRQAYLDAGWPEVVMLDEGRWFDRWAFEKRSKAKGGHVYLAVSSQGAVEAHEGYLPRKEAQRLDRVDSDVPKAVRPEISSPLRRYLDLHRHAAVRAKLLDHPSTALRLLLAHAIAGSPLWHVDCERQRAEKADTMTSVANSPAQLRFDERRKAALAFLDVDPDAPALTGITGVGLGRVFDLLSVCEDAEVLELASIVMGETLEAGGPLIEPLGLLLNVNIGAVWQADEAFFTLVRDRAVLTAMVAEVAGPDAAAANADVPGRVLKAIIHDSLEGRNGRRKVEGWAPRWLRFPRSAYLGEEPQPVELVDIDPD